VLKECFGSFGQQVYLLTDMDSLRQKVVELAGSPLLFQELISESYGHDTRINVVGGRVAACMLRRSTDGDFRSNLTRGGAMENYTPTPQEAALAIRATELLGLDFAGVDILFGKNGPILCEVNSNAFFAGIERVTGINIAGKYADHIIEQMKNS
jgi:RimK family alpha-L-glutamate ligase